MQVVTQPISSESKVRTKTSHQTTNKIQVISKIQIIQIISKKQEKPGSAEIKNIAISFVLIQGP